MEKKDIELLLQNYREGTATEAEKALLESWYLSQDPGTLSDLSPAELAEDLLLIAEGLPLQGAVRRILWWPRIAAAAAIAAIFFLIVFKWPLTRHEPRQTALTILQTSPGQHKTLTLADSSQVWVQAGSTLRYPNNFDGTTREVYLSGEAYFDIQHNARKPFIVHSGNVLITVLGTAFDIRQDTINHRVEVTVTSGKVSVTGGGKLLGVLTANRQLSFNILSGQTDERSVDAAQVTVWQRIGFHFDDITLAEAARQLEVAFKVRIDFGNERVKNCRFTGAAFNGDSLETILTTICDFNHATFHKQSDGSILIDGPGCDPTSN